MKASATVKHADAQQSRIALFLILDIACGDVSPNEDVIPTRPKAQEALVAKPMEARNARISWKSWNGGF